MCICHSSWYRSCTSKGNFHKEVRVPQEERVVFVVNGYGCHVVPVLVRYGARIIRMANEMNPKIIMLCGGATQQKTAPNKSEAEVLEWILFYALQHEMLFTVQPEIILEEDSFTTLGNIRNAAHLLRNTPFDRIVFFCEAQRALKTLILARHFFGLLGPDRISV